MRTEGEWGEIGWAECEEVRMYFMIPLLKMRRG